MSFTPDQLVIFAARAGNVSLLEERVRAGGDINHVDAQHGSALAEAIRKGNLDVLDWLIANGVEVNVQYQGRDRATRNWHCDTPSHRSFIDSFVLEPH